MHTTFQKSSLHFSSFLWSTYVYDNSAALCFNIIHYHPFPCFKNSIGFNSWSLPPRETLRVDIGFLMNHSTESLQRVSTYLDSVYEKPRELYHCSVSLREGLVTNTQFPFVALSHEPEMVIQIMPYPTLFSYSIRILKNKTATKGKKHA